MGFDTVIASVIAITIIVLVAYTFISGSTSITENAINNYKELIKNELKRLNTAIKILNVTYSSGTLQAYFKNTGNERFMDFEGFDLFIYGSTEGGSNVAIYVTSVQYNITRELINPGIFDPHEIASVRSTMTLSNGTYTLKICTPNAVCDTLDFEVRL